MNSNHSSSQISSSASPDASGASLNVDKLVKESEAAAIICLSPKTLQKWRWAGQGPAYYKISNSVRYRVGDLLEFRERCRRSSTSDPGAD